MRTEQKKTTDLPNTATVLPKKPYTAPAVLEEAVFAKLQAACSATQATLPPCRIISGGS